MFQEIVSHCIKHCCEEKESKDQTRSMAISKLNSHVWNGKTLRIHSSDLLHPDALLRLEKLEI